MYSRYGKHWDADHPPPAREPSAQPPPREEPRRLERDGHSPKGGLSSLLSKFKDMDTGDMLLLAVLVFLLIEGEDLEVVILIAVVLFLL